MGHFRLMAELPSGTVTFLFTDLQSSTRLWEELPEAMSDALARHDQIMRAATAAHGGHVVKTTGDGVHAVFSTACDAVLSAVDAQRALVAGPWGEIGELRVRMGLHTGTAEGRDGDFYGSSVNQAARLMSVAHGGQIVCSRVTADLARPAPEIGTGGVQFTQLGVHRLRDLSASVEVFQVIHPDLRSSFPPLHSLDAFPGNLPRQLTSFVGREEEVRRIAELVRTRPLVTLTGVGGVGKTRLAVQTAAELLPQFPEGAWLCELAPVTDAGAVWETVAAALDISPGPGRPISAAVLDQLEYRNLLLVLDNCEHLLDAVALVVDEVMRRCQRVALIATSREGLALAGEQVVAIPSLGVPANHDDLGVVASSDAVRLFVDRARDANVDFELTSDTAAAVAHLCRRLDGIPLAIELAAARVGSLSPDDLVARLDQRFKLLTRGSRAALERHQTLRNTIAWSYDLLDPAERDALNRISVFAGGCDLAAAEQVLAGGAIDPSDVADLLAQLADKSLLLVESRGGSSTRYGLLETIRQYAQERLEANQETQAVRRAHADYYVTRAETAGSRLRGPDPMRFADAVELDTDNFRTALDWAVETSSPDHALGLVAPLAVNGMAIGYSAMDWAAAAVSIPDAASHSRYPVVAAWAAWGALMHGDLELGRDLVEQAVAAETALGSYEPATCQAPGVLGFFTGDMEMANRWATEWVARSRAADDSYELAHALILLATSVQFADRDGSIAFADEAIHVARSAGITSALSIGLSFIAAMLEDEDDARVLPLLDEAMDAASAVGDRMTMSQVPFFKGWRALEHADWTEALRLATDAGVQKLALGDVAMLLGCYRLAAIALTQLGRVEPASVLYGAFDRWRNVQLPDNVDRWTSRTKALLDERLDETAFARSRDRGAAMDHRDLVALMCVEVDAG